MSLPDARTWFTRHDATLVLAQTSVTEFVPLREDDKLRVRSELQELEAFPMTYFRIGDLRCSELASAVSAFDAQSEYVQIDPFVPSFWRTFWRETPRDGHEIVLRRQMEGWIGLRLDEQVFMLWSNPRNFTNSVEDTQTLERILSRFRSQRRRRQERFREELGDALESCERNRGDIDAFAMWASANPRRCPGWRFYFEVLQAWIRNVTDHAKDGDVNDITNIFGVPYVDMATLDARFVDYAKQATRELKRIDATVDYDRRVFKSFSDIVHAVG
jgi:hypothetical protein